MCDSTPSKRDLLLTQNPAFRDQDFAELPLQSAVDYVAYYGRLHVHPSSPTPTGFPQIRLIHRSQGDKTAGVLFKGRNNSVSWHSDVSIRAPWA